MDSEPQKSCSNANGKPKCRSGWLKPPASVTPLSYPGSDQPTSGKAEAQNPSHFDDFHKSADKAAAQNKSMDSDRQSSCCGAEGQAKCSAEPLTSVASGAPSPTSPELSSGSDSSGASSREGKTQNPSQFDEFRNGSDEVTAQTGNMDFDAQTIFSGGEGQPSRPTDLPMPRAADLSLRPVYMLVVANSAEASVSALMKLFVSADDLPTFFGSPKLAKILARCCLRPVIKRPKRLTLYWVGDVVEVALKLRRGEIVIDWERQTASFKTKANEKP